MSVRPASAHDETALRAIDRAAWSSSSGPAPSPTPGSSFFGSRCAPQDVLVAERAAKLVGYVWLGPPTELHSNRHVLEIKGIAVDPAQRRRGVGNALLTAAAQAAAARGARRLTLRVLDHNTAARSLYERCGFKLEGVLHEEFLLDGRYVDDLLMALELEADTSA